MLIEIYCHQYFNAIIICLEALRASRQDPWLKADSGNQRRLWNGRNPVGVLKEEDLEAGQSEQDKGVFSALLFSLLSQPSPDLWKTHCLSDGKDAKKRKLTKGKRSSHLTLSVKMKMNEGLTWTQVLWMRRRLWNEVAKGKKLMVNWMRKVNGEWGT